MGWWEARTGQISYGFKSTHFKTTIRTEKLIKWEEQCIERYSKADKLTPIM